MSRMYKILEEMETKLNQETKVKSLGIDDTSSLIKMVMYFIKVEQPKLKGTLNLLRLNLKRKLRVER